METEEIKLARIMFIKEFTEEMILNLNVDFQLEQNIEIGKIKQKFLDENEEEKEDFKKIVQHKVLAPMKYPKTRIRKPEIKKAPVKIVNLALKTVENPPKPGDISQEELKVLQSIKPEYAKQPEDFFLGKIAYLIRDNLVQSIECQGPGKYILVKKFDKINVTKTALTQDEIHAIISEFSKKAKIPLIGGMLKAAIGNLVISAVTSDSVGSRFIINKLIPAINLAPRY